MGTRFRKSVKICKGVKVNFSGRIRGTSTTHLPFSLMRQSSLVEVVRGVVLVYSTQAVSLRTTMLSMVAVAGVLARM